MKYSCTAHFCHSSKTCKHRNGIFYSFESWRPVLSKIWGRRMTLFECFWSWLCFFLCLHFLLVTLDWLINNRCRHIPRTGPLLEWSTGAVARVGITLALPLCPLPQATRELFKSNSSQLSISLIDRLIEANGQLGTAMAPEEKKRDSQRELVES